MIVTEIMKLNIVQGLYIVLRPTPIQEKFLVFTGEVRVGWGAEGVQIQDTTPDPPCIIIIYLEYT